MSNTRKQRGIAFVGDLTVDKYPELGKIHLGGASLNGAIWAMRSGAKQVSIFAAVGTDSAGTLFQDKIKSEGINSDAITVLSGDTSSIDIILDSNGDHQWGNWNAGVLVNYHLGESEFKLLQTHTAVSLTIYGKTRHLLSEFTGGWRKKNNHPFLAVNFDDLSQFERSTATVEQNMQHIDAGFFGLDIVKDAKLLFDLQKLSQKTGKLIVVTLGKNGAKAWKGDKEYTSPALHISENVIKDTTGAGDAFLAGFLVRYLHDVDIQASLVRGNEIAAQKVEILGAY